MSEGGQSIEAEPILLRDVGEALFRTRPFSGTTADALGSVQSALRVRAKAGITISDSTEPTHYYWLLLEGEARGERPEKDGSWSPAGIAHAGEGFGEVPLLMGKPPGAFRLVASQDSVLLRFDVQEFWSMLACCPSVRQQVLTDFSQRLQSYQSEALHREKLVSLGTLAAGLMHELHNPGSAAKRAASQLRENLQRLLELSLRNADKQKTPEQLQCMRDLLQRTLSRCQAPAMSSLEQSDAEEAMGEWLISAGVDNAYAIAPALVDTGFQTGELACARTAFEKGNFSDTLNWLGALVSSVSLVCAIEESISRVSELVMAVKKFAYDDKSGGRELDVHDSLQSTLTILNHKLRTKNISVEKRFAASPSTIFTRGSALSQVWTNLIDNAVDASPNDGRILIETSTEAAWLLVSISDQGSGIAPEVLPHIFEAFFTTKPQGSGTGLGLEIVHRIVTHKFGGTIQVESEPGNTRFLVRLPLKDPAAAQPQ
jgi:signal transduction histidine kinase